MLPFSWKLRKAFWKAKKNQGVGSNMLEPPFRPFSIIQHATNPSASHRKMLQQGSWLWSLVSLYARFECTLPSNLLHPEPRAVWFWSVDIVMSKLFLQEFYGISQCYAESIHSEVEAQFGSWRHCRLGGLRYGMVQGSVWVVITFWVYAPIRQWDVS